MTRQLLTLAAALIGFSLAGATLTVNPEKSVGTLRKLHGVNRAPRGTYRPFLPYGMYYSMLRAPRVRVADTILDNTSWRSGDFSMIFPNFHADPSKPENYYFRDTDEYMRSARRDGAALLFRLGETPDFSSGSLRLQPVRDADKMSDIASHIIWRYNDGWGRNGFRMMVFDWEIWSSPDVKGPGATWGGTLDEYNQFYVTMAKKLAPRHPQLFFGGPGHSRPDREMRRAFLKHCRDNQAPLNFFTYQCTAKTPRGVLIHEPKEVRKDLDEFGYKDTKIYLTSWGPVGGNSLDQAAFIASTLARWELERVPLDMAFFRCAGNGNGGLGAVYPSVTYYGLLAASQVFTDFPQKLWIKRDDRSLEAVAGKNADGDCALLISCYQRKEKEVSVKFPAPLEYCQVNVLDRNHRLTPTAANFEDGELKLKYQGSSAVFVVRFKPAEKEGAK